MSSFETKGQDSPQFQRREFRDLFHQSRLLEALHPLQNKSGSGCDCSLILENNQQVMIHGAILRTVSPLVESVWQQTSTLHGSCEEFIIIYPTVSMSTVTRFLNLVYTGSCTYNFSCEKEELESLLQILGINWEMTVGSILGGDEDTYTIANIEEGHNAQGEGSSSAAVGYNGQDSCEQVNCLVTDKCKMDGEYTVIGGIYEDEEDEIAVASSCQTSIKPTVFMENLQVTPVSFSCVTDNRKTCSKFCSYDCVKILDTWTIDKRKDVEAMFKSEKSSYGTKNNLLRHLKSQLNIGSPTDTYIVFGQSFCLKFFSNLTNISEYILKSVLIDFWKGYSEYTHGNKGMMKHLTVAQTSFICWMKQFAESYGQFSPETNTLVLSYWLNKQFLFNLYKDETCGPHCSQAAFYQNFKKHFDFNRADKSLPHIVISKYSSHSICNQCVALNNNRRQARTETELQLARDLENQHKVLFGDARRSIQEIKQTALSFPEDNLFIQIDGMDNKKSYIPRLLEKSKEMSGTERLASKISGCILYSGWYKEKRKCQFYVNHDQFENGSDLVVTLIYLLIEDFISDHKKLPRKLHLNLGKSLTVFSSLWNGRMLYGVM